MDKFRKIPGMSWAASIKYFLSAECNACRFIRSMIELALVITNVALVISIFFYVISMYILLKAI